jgi:hypothetical protein
MRLEPELFEDVVELDRLVLLKPEVELLAWRSLFQGFLSHPFQ